LAFAPLATRFGFHGSPTMSESCFLAHTRMHLQAAKGGIRMETAGAADAIDTKLVSSPPPVQIPAADHPLINLANDLLYRKSGFYSAADPDVFSSDFIFRGPYIGPLNKKDYLDTMGTFKIYEAIPDINPNAWGWSIDPIDPNRVWFMVRNTGTFTGKPGIGLGSSLPSFPPNGAKIKGCPETFSMVFDSQQKLKHLTVGYVADRFEGNVSGKGAAVGIFNAIGLPFPRPGPMLKFAQWFTSEVASEVTPRSYSTKDIPEWWTSEDKAGEGYS